MTDLNEIKAALADRAASIVPELLPGGKRTGNEWKVSGSASPTGEPISVVLKGFKAGTVLFCISGHGGSILDLLMEVRGLPFVEALDEARRLLGWAAWSGGTRRSIDPAVTARALAAAATREADANANEAFRIRAAEAIWAASWPMYAIDGNVPDFRHGRMTAAAAYLVGRGIAPPEDPITGWPASLRSYALLMGPDGERYPALVARVQDAAGQFRGVWRIFLERRTVLGIRPRTPGKAPIATPKMGLGATKGGFVPIVPRARGRLAVCEGIETAMAVAELIRRSGGRSGVYACLSASGIANVEIPSQVTQVQIYADHDEPKERNGKIVAPAGQTAAEKLRARLQHQGIACSILLPRRGLDWLDTLVQAKKDAGE